MEVLSIGHGATVVSSKVLTILPYKSAPIKNLKKQAKDHNKFFDATFGKPTRSIVILVGGYMVASSTQADTLRDRFTGHPQ